MISVVRTELAHPLVLGTADVTTSLLCQCGRGPGLGGGHLKLRRAKDRQVAVQPLEASAA